MQEREYPKLYDRKSSCCGCSACYAVCPAGAIAMEPDEEGFLYPRVDENRCICCYQCLKVCAFQAAQRENGIS